jgi:hypothetical protein
MKLWQAMLITIGLQAAQIFVPKIPNKDAQTLAAGAIVVINGYMVRKTSNSNPDGTPASVAYSKEVK